MKRKIDPQLLLSIGVLLISMAAVYVSIRQADIMNKQTEILIEQTKANAWPSLELGLQRSFSLNENNVYIIDAYRIGLVNKGTGPAIIKGVKVTVDGQPAKNWGQVYKLMKIPSNIESTHSNSNVSHQILSAGEIKSILNLALNPPLMEWFYQNGDKVSIEICYQSVFKDSYLVKRMGFKSNIERVFIEETNGCDFEEEELFVQ